MRHGRLRRKLGVKTNHRKALLRNLIRNLVIHKRIRTTWAKAKEASSLADQMVELAKRGDLHARRTLISRLGSSQTAHDLITKIAPHFKERRGGYPRVLHLGARNGDGGEMALLEFTAVIEMPEKKKKPKKEKKAAAPEIKHAGQETEKPKKEKTKEKPEKASSEEKEKAAGEQQKEAQKKGGFLGALRRFLKGDEETH